MKGATMLATLQRLGGVPSFSRPSVSDDNPLSQSLFKTLMYRPGYPSKPFADLQAARPWVPGFVRWYNGEHRHSALRFVTPEQRHGAEDVTLLRLCTAFYEAVRAANPTRWSGFVRTGSPCRKSG